MNNISKIFKCLEDSKELEIEDYMLSSTSLEDIYFQINKRGNIIIDKNININTSINEDLIDENNNNIVPKNFFIQLFSQLKRVLLSLKRNIITFIFELILSIFAAVILFVFFFREWMILLTSKKKDYNLVYVLEANRNYIYDQNNFLKNSYLYDLSNNILLKNINKEPNNITDFIESSYQNSFANIAKGCIYIKKIKNNETNKYIYDVYNTEIYTGDFGNVYANTMLLVSHHF